jgi:hypothetical protein
MVEHLPHHPKAEGLSQAMVLVLGERKIAKKIQNVQNV